MEKQQIIEATIETARREVGVREVGNSNSGPRIEQYQASTTLGGTGWPWCAAFQSWDMLTTLGRELCDAVWLRSASCDQILTWGRAHGIVFDTPVAGAQGLVMASKHDATHIFKVADVLPGAVQSIEGNTNTDGSRNGNGVYLRRRTLSNRYLYLHWMRLLPEGAALPGRVEPAPVAMPASPFDHCPTFDLILGGQVAEKVPSLNGRTWVPAWKWAEWMHAPLGWQPATQSVLLGGREVAAQPIMVDGRAWLPVVKLAAHFGLKAQFDGAQHRIEVTQ